MKLDVGDIIAMRGQTLLHWTDESLIRYGYVENCCGIQGKSPLPAYRFRPLCAAFLWSLPKNQTNQDNRPNTAFFAAGFMVESMRTQKSGERVLTEKLSPPAAAAAATSQRGPRRFLAKKSILHTVCLFSLPQSWLTVVQLCVNLTGSPDGAHFIHHRKHITVKGI